MTLMHTYRVHLQRVEQKAGPTSNFSIDVKAQGDRMARLTAESQYHGYRATGAHRVK
jgi:hypothetical protein